MTFDEDLTDTRGGACLRAALFTLVAKGQIARDIAVEVLAKELQSTGGAIVVGLVAAAAEADEAEGAPAVLGTVEQLAIAGTGVETGAVVDLPGYFRLSLTANDAMIERAIPDFAAAFAAAQAKA